MRYLYNPVTGALDDVETPKLGEKYFASAETDEIIKNINDEFGPGTMFPASEAPQPEMKTPQSVFEFGQRNPAANGGMMRQNYAAGPLILPPAMLYGAGLALGIGSQLKGENVLEQSRILKEHISENSDDPKVQALLMSLGIVTQDVKDNVSESVTETLAGLVIGGGEKEEAKPIILSTPIENYEGSFKDEGLTIPETEKQLPETGDKIDVPLTTGGSEIPETKKEDFIFYSKDTKKEIKELTDTYRETKTRKKGVTISVEADRGIRERVKSASNQPIMNIDDKVELINIVINKFKELEGRLPTATELKNLPGTKQISNLSNVLRDNKIELPKGKRGDYDRTDAASIKARKETKQLKAIEENTITNYEDESFFPKTITLKDNTEVNAKQFFEKNLSERINYGPGRKGNPALKNEELAELFNTNKRKIEETIKRIKSNPDFEADYPPPRAKNYAAKEAAKIIKDARDYAKSLPNGELHVKNIRVQEKAVRNLNNLFKNEILNITNYPRIVEDANTTMDKETGLISQTTAKTEQELIDRAKKEQGLFQIWHNVAKSSKDKQIEFLSNRHISLYKPNMGLAKAAESYITKQKDKPDYEEKVEDFNNWLKERGLRIKIDNKFYGIEFQEMINSKTGEFTGMNRTLEYYGLPKFENGVPLKKIKKAAGGVIPDQEIMNYANGGRINYENGSPRGPNEPEGDDFLNKLEFNFNNIDDVTIDDEPITFDDSKSKIAQFNDLLDYKNIPYIADMGVQAALRIGEFGARIIPATGELVSDLIRKPLFKTPSSYERTENYANMVDDTEMPGEKQEGAKFIGGPIFKNFLENITPTSTEKLVGLDTLINEEKKKMIKRGDSSLMVKVGETASLGGELVAPIFPGLKLLKAFASAKGVKPTKEVAKTMEQEIDQMAAAKGMTRREFLTATGAVGTIALAKMLGIAGELPKIAKTAEAVTSVAKTADGVPQYLYDLKNVIRLRGELQPSSSAFLDGQEVYTYKGVTLYHNTYPKDGSFRIAKEFETDSIVPGESSYNKVEMEVNKGGDVVVDEGLSTQKVVKGADEYEEATAYPAREGGEDVDFYVEDDFHKQLEEISKELEEIDSNVEMFGYDKWLKSWQQQYLL